MAKRILMIMALLAAGCICQAQSGKVVRDSKGNFVGRYVKTNATTYTVSLQDEYELPLEGREIVTVSAAAGQGIVYLKFDVPMPVNVLEKPAEGAGTVAQISDSPQAAGLPRRYGCLGLENGYYKIRVKDVTGYVPADLMVWDSMDTF